VKKLIYSISLFLFALLISTSANALVVGYQDISFDFPIVGSELPFTHYDLDPGIVSSDTFTQYNPFGTVAVYNTGDTFVADNTTNAFANAVSLLTNSIGDYIHAGWPYPLFTPESQLLYGPGFTDPDFFGSQIDKMTLVVNDFDFSIYDTPTPAAVGGGHIDYTITYESTSNSVPEPATILLLSPGLLGLVRFGRKKFKKIELR